MFFLAVWMERSHGQDELVPDHGHADPAGVDVVAGQAGQLHSVLVVREQVTISVLRHVLHCCFTQTVRNLEIKIVKLLFSKFEK